VRTARELGIDETSIERGMRNTRWRGRLEHLRVRDKDSLSGSTADTTCTRSSRRTVLRHARAAPAHAGVRDDERQDVRPVVDRLFLLFDRVIATEPFPPRSVKAEAFAGATPIPNPDDAFRAALASSEPAIVITGSLYLAGAAIAYFDGRRQMADGRS
jgi:folylpolyglutamate synthase/dihydropteroate synthase